MTRLAFLALLLAACSSSVDAPAADAGLDGAAALCAEHFGALPYAACVEDTDCAAGQWCMVTCSFFHAVEQVNRCAPLKPAGAWCSHVGGDHECASGMCDTNNDVCL